MDKEIIGLGLKFGWGKEGESGSYGVYLANFIHVGEYGG